jgi:hypothetical protein
MSNPAVTFGCTLLPSMVGRSSFPLGIRARRTHLQTLRVLRRGSAFSSHLRRIHLPGTGVKIALAVALFHVSGWPGKGHGSLG